MPPHKCPNCHTVVFLPIHVTDYVHDCAKNKPNQPTSYEDIPTIGSWEDYSGSGDTKNLMMQGIENPSEYDLVARAKGVNEDEKTDRGNRKSTHRTRNKLTYFSIR